MNLIELTGLSVVESTGLRPGQMLKWKNSVTMHPLDVIAVTTPNALDRLPIAMAWLLAEADRKFEKAKARLTIASW